MPDLHDLNDDILFANYNAIAQYMHCLSKSSVDNLNYIVHVRMGNIKWGCDWGFILFSFTYIIIVTKKLI